MEQQKGPAQIPPLTARLRQRFEGRTIYSHSFDKGFYSKDNLKTLQQAGIEQVVLPKRGKRNQEETQRESTPEFRQLRNAHSAVESNINMLEHHGLNRCPDKGLHGYKRYAGLSVLAYNLHILGNCLIAKERQKLQKEADKKPRHLKKAA
jgi:transposase, IS5 family